MRAIWSKDGENLVTGVRLAGASPWRILTVGLVLLFMCAGGLFRPAASIAAPAHGGVATPAHDGVSATGARAGLDTAAGAARARPQAAGQGSIWLTGHDADFHCSSSNAQCHYLKVAVDYVRNGSTLPVLVLDHGTEVQDAITLAYTLTTDMTPTLNVVDPRSGFAGLPLVSAGGAPLYSAIIVASDTTCGGCDNNDTTGITPDSNVINARAADIAQFFNAGGGILALAGAENRDVYYRFIPVPATGVAVTEPFTLTSVGLSLGLIQGTGSSDSDVNCCATHNSFQLPPSGSPYQVAEVDGQGFAETLVTRGATICGGGFCTPTPSPTNTSTSTATATTTSTSTSTATSTPTQPTSTSTSTATSTAVPPTRTNTAVPPPTATNTAVPPPTATNTAVPPSSTPVPPTATSTAVPPTSTSTATGTNTALPPTATNTSTTVPPPTATSTPVPPSTSTGTSAPTATSGAVHYAPAITLDHSSAHIGTTVRVTGHGFAPHEQITLALNSEGLATAPVVVTTDANGAFTATFVTPDAILNGLNTVSAVGNISRIPATATLIGIRNPPAQYYFAGAFNTAREHSALALLNPTGEQAQVRLTFYFANGTTSSATIYVEARRLRVVSLATLTAYHGIFGLSVSASQVVTAQLVVTRDGRDGDTLLGNGGLGRHWYLAEGYTGLTFLETVSILNPGSTAATVRLQLLPFGRFRGRTVYITAPAHTNALVNVNGLLPGRSLSIIADADQPVVVERTLTFSIAGRTPGYGLTMQRGTNVATTSWLFAEGTTVNRFETYLTILNPAARQVRVTAVFYGTAGQVLGSRSILMAGLSRANIKLNDVLNASGIASAVTSTGPVVVERPEYFGSPNGVRIPGSDVFGRTGTGVRWSFPGGETTSKLSEFLLLYNPSGLTIPVDVTVYESNGGIVSKRINLRPSARRNVDLSHDLGTLTELHGSTLRAVNGVGFVAEQTVFTRDHTTLRSTGGLAQ